MWEKCGRINTTPYSIMQCNGARYNVINMQFHARHYNMMQWDVVSTQSDAGRRNSVSATAVACHPSLYPSGAQPFRQRATSRLLKLFGGQHKGAYTILLAAQTADNRYTFLEIPLLSQLPKPKCHKITDWNLL